MIRNMPVVERRTQHALVYCPICTHTVEGEVIMQGKVAKVRPGQKCSRCASALDAGYIIRHDRAA